MQTSFGREILAGLRAYHWTWGLSERRFDSIGILWIEAKPLTIRFIGHIQSLINYVCKLLRVFYCLTSRLHFVPLEIEKRTNEEVRLIADQHGY